MTTTRYFVPQMDCSAEEQLLRNSLKAVSGIEQLEFDLIGRQLTIHHSLSDPDPLSRAIAQSGLSASLVTDGTPVDGDAGHRPAWRLSAASGALALAAELVGWSQRPGVDGLVIALAAASMALGGRATLRKGLAALRTRTLNINLLMTIAVAGAILIGHWPEAAMVTFLFGLAETIEGAAMDRARNAIRALMALAPDVATVRGDDGEWRTVPTHDVALSTVVRVLPGERVPLDGEVVAGHSAVNQAPITGESLPVDKAPGDAVFAGTINEQGPLEIRVTAAAGMTTLDRIARAIQTAQAQRAPTQRFVDRFAQVYTPAVVALAAVLAVATPLVTAVTWSESVYRALVLLVIACPCALVLSTPVTVVSGLAAAARRGILVKGGVHLEEGRRLRLAAMDKTGTLTMGEPVVTDVVALNGMARRDVLRIGASLNVHSTHPVARAVVAALQAEKDGGASDGLLEAVGVRALPGRGVTGNVAGRPYFIGNHRLAEELAVCSPQVEDTLARIEREGKTTVVLGSDREPIAVLGVADTLRPTSLEAIGLLHAQGVRTAMLTGDNEVTAQAIAQQLGIDDVRANLLPDDKQAAVAELQAAHGAVGMVGDGVNDAPALARATVGFAMGAAGTDTAIETADVAFMDDDLRKLPEFLALSRRTAQILAQNIALSIGIKAAFFVLTLIGSATLWMAVFADMGTSLLVVMNGLRLLRFAAPRAG